MQCIKCKTLHNNEEGICTNCGYDRFVNPIVGLKDLIEVEEKAKNWWNTMSPRIICWNLQQHYYPKSTTIGINEIVNIYKKEHLTEEKPQVDFELLLVSLSNITSTLCDVITSASKANLELFFKLLSENPSFAHKASLTLKKLLK